MRVLGIDLGTIRMGYGVIDEDGGAMSLVAAGILEAPAKDPIEQRLRRLYDGLLELIREHQPGAVAIEEPFVVQAPRRSAMAVGEARAIAMLAAAQHNLPVAQYPPAKVRSTVADYGAGRKEQVRDMVALLLGQPMDHLVLDASDALAVAICHLRHAELAGLLAGDNASSLAQLASARRGARRRS